MSDRDYRIHFAQHPLRKSEVQLVVMTGDKLVIMGELQVKVQKPNDESVHLLSAVIVKRQSNKSFVPLLGRNWLDVLYPGWRDRFVNSIRGYENRGLDRERAILLSQI